MAIIKNFGLSGIGSDVQLGKSGLRLKATTGVLTLRNAGDTANAGLTVGALQTGNLTVSTGATVNMGGNVLTNIGNAVGNTDAVNYQQMSQAIADAVAGIDVTALQAEVDAIETAVGLSATGTLVPFAAGGYAEGKTTFKAAVEAIDAALKLEETARADADALLLPLAGGTMSGAIAMGGSKITGLATPTANTDAATKAYVDSAIAGFSWKLPVDAIVADHITDAETYVTGQRIVDTTANKIFTVLTDGAVGTPATFDAGVDLVDGDAFFNKDNHNGYVFNGTQVVQFTGGSAVTAGIGLTLNGNQLDVNMGAGVTVLPAGQVGLDIRPNSGLWLTEDGTAASTGANAQVAIRLDGSTLSMGATGLKVSDALVARITTLETDLAGLTTDDVTEGTTNLYHTDARSRAALSGGTGVNYVAGTGVISVDTDVIATKAYVDSVIPASGGMAVAYKAFTSNGSVALGEIEGFITRVTVYLTTAASTDSAVTVGTAANNSLIASAADIDSSLTGAFVVNVGTEVTTADALSIYVADGAQGRVVVEYVAGLLA